MAPTTTVEELCTKHDLVASQLADRAGLDERRVRAIIAGNWTPSPAERDKIASTFGVTRDQIAWCHRGSVQHIQGHGPQFGRSP